MIFGSSLGDALGTMCVDIFFLIVLINGIVLLVKKFTQDSSKAAANPESASQSTPSPTQKIATNVATSVGVAVLKAAIFAWIGHRPQHHRHG